MSRLRILFLIVALSTQSVAISPIGHVTELKGSWCKNGSVLKKGDAVALEDDIRYCFSGAALKTEYIRIGFNRTPPNALYEHTYLCSTPGVCGSPPQRLWLAGPYFYGPSSPGTATPLLSKPKTASYTVPDMVITKANQLPSSLRVSILGKKLKICRIAMSNPSSLIETPTIVDCSNDDPIYSGVAALYGVYPTQFNETSSTLRGSGESPLGLLLVTEPDSPAITRWSSVPETFRLNDDIATTRERRSFILDLHDNELSLAPGITTSFPASQEASRPANSHVPGTGTAQPASVPTSRPAVPKPPEPR